MLLSIGEYKLSSYIWYIVNALWMTVTYIYMNVLYFAGTSVYIWNVTVINNAFLRLNVTLTEVNNSTTDIHVEKYIEKLGCHTYYFVLNYSYHFPKIYRYVFLLYIHTYMYTWMTSNNINHFDKKNINLVTFFLFWLTRWSEAFCWEWKKIRVFTLVAKRGNSPE